MMDTAIVDEIIIGLIVQVLVTFALFSWGRWVARRQGHGVFWRRAAWLPWVSFALSAGGLLVSVLFLVRAFGAVDQADPARKAQMLAESISNAMNVAALTIVPGNALFLVGIVVFAIGSLRRPSTAPSR